MRKAITVIGIIGFLFFFASYILPNLIGAPLAAYNSYRVWNESNESSSKKVSTPSRENLLRFPAPLGVLSDYEGIFSEEQNLSLTKILNDYEKTTSREIIIVTIDSITPYNNLKDFSTDLGNEWRIGKAKSNNGLLIVMSKNLKKIRITTGYGTEKILTDKICKEIIDSTIIPEFRRGDYYVGIEKGVQALQSKWL
ncbi:YgcG family protein [uncultured Dokdonia sp.]|uniref:TPM domain-containing protein n=1 Tax=Dokdonia sp. R78006 TaxID=3093866 RepID=UPI002602F7F5|nr:TPM domain-containing protein [uncultured Dokdonia sp.]